MNGMLRLRRSSDFAIVRQQGQLLKHPMVLFNYVENNLSHNRYGFVITKRIGNAVTRNRVKRQLREATYQLHPRLIQGHDIVIIARPVIVGQHFSAILRILDELIRRASLGIEESQR